jgi:hypothetical protein
VVVRLEPGGPEATREAVREADLDDALSELWLGGHLRKGHPAVRFEEMTSILKPLLKEGSDRRCQGFALETTNAAGECTRCEFSINALLGVASRAALRLVAGGRLEAGDKYYYEIVHQPRPAPVAPSPSTDRGGAAGFSVTVRNPPLGYLPLPIRPLLERAKTRGEIDERWVPVFYTEEALERAERLARKGGESTPPIESGGVLVGTLCSCPETGEFFDVVCEVLPVLDAEEAEFSLTYTGKSWQRLQAVMKMRQAQPGTSTHRILGQCHGHNFLPGGGEPPCELCPKLKVCTRTSVFVSAADRSWTRAIFSRQPWQLCHIFGLNARNEKVHTLFGLRDGSLLDRGFHVLPEFCPEALSRAGTAP